MNRLLTVSELTKDNLIFRDHDPVNVTCEVALVLITAVCTMVKGFYIYAVTKVYV